MRLAVFLTLLPGTLAAQDWDCSRPEMLPQQGINFCLHADWQAQDARLNAVYQRMLARLAPADQDTLREGQRAWITYRDKACAIEALQMEGGSGEAMLLYGCYARLTERRADDLEAVVELF